MFLYASPDLLPRLQPRWLAAVLGRCGQQEHGKRLGLEKGVAIVTVQAGPGPINAFRFNPYQVIQGPGTAVVSSDWWLTYWYNVRPSRSKETHKKLSLRPERSKDLTRRGVTRLTLAT